MSLEQRIELPAGLGQGSWSMVEEEEKNGEERVERGRALIIRLTHSIEG